MNTITMSMNVDGLILQALREDITSEDITTNAIMKKYQEGSVQLICKQDGIIAGLPVFERVFHLTDPKTEVFLFVEDGAEVKNGQQIRKEKNDATDSTHIAKESTHHCSDYTAGECAQHTKHYQTGSRLLPSVHQAGRTA